MASIEDLSLSDVPWAYLECVSHMCIQYILSDEKHQYYQVNQTRKSIQREE